MCVCVCLFVKVGVDVCVITVESVHVCVCVFVKGGGERDGGTEGRRGSFGKIWRGTSVVWFTASDGRRSRKANP